MIKDQYKNISEPTSEEEYLINSLELWGIEFEREVKISNLKGDTKSYRIADFYLPEYKLYIEYFGMYNSTKEVRIQYDKKAQVYISNGIPTIFLYPHELGFLEYAFHKKILKVLKVFNFKKELSQYKKNRKNNKIEGPNIWLAGIIISTVLISCIGFMDTGLTANFTIVLIVLLVIIGLVPPSLRHIYGYIKYIIEEQ